MVPEQQLEMLDRYYFSRIWESQVKCVCFYINQKLQKDYESSGKKQKYNKYKREISLSSTLRANPK